MPRKPTRKQKAIVKVLTENEGISVRKAAKQVGYSNEMADNPVKILESKGFLEAFSEVVPDKKLIKVHNRGLEAFRETPRIIDRDAKGMPVYSYERVPDFHAQHKFLETAYKIKARLHPANNDIPQNLTVQLVVYGKQDNTNPIPVPAKKLPDAVFGSDGRRIQTSSDSVAPPQREGQDSLTGSD